MLKNMDKWGKPSLPLLQLNIFHIWPSLLWDSLSESRSFSLQNLDLLFRRLTWACSRWAVSKVKQYTREQRMNTQYSLWFQSSRSTAMTIQKIVIIVESTKHFPLLNKGNKIWWTFRQMQQPHQEMVPLQLSFHKFNFLPQHFATFSSFYSGFQVCQPLFHPLYHLLAMKFSFNLLLPSWLFRDAGSTNVSSVPSHLLPHFILQGYQMRGINVFTSEKFLVLRH